MTQHGGAAGMDEPTRTLRIRVLLAMHVLVGAVAASITAYFHSYHWPAIAEVAYIGFFVSEIVLLGMWVGLGSNWWARFFGLLLGTVWLCLIFLAAMGRENFLVDLPEVMLVVSACTIGVSGSTALLRKTTARVELRTDWPLQPMAKDLQFNMKTLLCLTTLLGTLLAMGGIIRSWGGENAGVVVIGCVFALDAMLAGCLLVFAGLGLGRNWIRIPIILAAVAMLGLLPPYYLGGSPWRFASWVGLTMVIAFWALASLFVIRSCGYRLVRLPTAREPKIAQLAQAVFPE